MAMPDDAGDKKHSRRRFIKWAGGSLAAGTAAVALGGGAAVGLLSANVEKAAAIPNAQTATSAAGETHSPSSTKSIASNTAEALADGAFSIFWITDTQFLSESNPALFKMANYWIVDNWARFNGKMVIHTGDFVQTGSVEQEWQNADDAMSVFTANRIPYTWCAGNHDNWVLGEPTSGWKGNAWTASLDPSEAGQAVNAVPYARWVGDYHDGMNTAVTFSASGLNFLIVNIEWNAQPDVLEWVRGILDDPNFGDYHVIVAPHAYINAYGSLHDSRWGATLADFVAGLTTLLDEHSSNVFLTLNGHFATECGYNTPQPINNRNELMFDRQDSSDAPGDQLGRGVDNPPPNDTDKVGGATVMVLTFEPMVNQIRARTYDLYWAKWRTTPTEEYTIDMFPNQVRKLQAVAQ
jgi:Calcineurin-like phosphoesterase